MSRKRKRKRNRAKKRRSASAVQEPPQAAASPLQRLLDTADEQPDPRDALEMFQTALDECQPVAAVSVFENADGRLWDTPDARCYLRAAFGVAASLWRLNRVEEATRHFEEVLVCGQWQSDVICDQAAHILRDFVGLLVQRRIDLPRDSPQLVVDEVTNHRP